MSSRQDRSRTSLEAGVSRLLPLVDQLEQAMNAESEALVSLDTDALDSAIRAKREGLSQLATTWRQSGLEQAIRNGDDDFLQQPDVRRLIERIRSLRESNEVAGGTIGSLLRSTREALGYLGVAAEPGSYGASGQSTGQARSRTLGLG